MPEIMISGSLGPVGSLLVPITLNDEMPDSRSAGSNQPFYTKKHNPYPTGRGTRWFRACGAGGHMSGKSTAEGGCHTILSRLRPSAELSAGRPRSWRAFTILTVSQLTVRLANEAQDLFGIVVRVGVIGDAGELVGRDLVLVDHPFQGRAIAEAVS